MTTTLDPATQACLERTRATVVNILVAVGVGIAASGFFLAGRDRGAVAWEPRLAERGAFGCLLVLMVLSFAVRRVGAGRSALQDPTSRAMQFHRAHVASASLGALAIPLGLAYGWAIRPQLDAVAPFWVAALALGVLAIPRAHELEEFNAPLPEPSEPRG